MGTAKFDCQFNCKLNLLNLIKNWCKLTAGQEKTDFYVNVTMLIF